MGSPYQKYRDHLRVAWLVPVAFFYWHPVLSEFTRRFPQTVIFTARWRGFAPGFEDSFKLELVGNLNYVEVNSQTEGYGSGITFLSPEIIPILLKLRPQIIFADSFRIWTLFALMLKPLGRWRVIVAYEGSSPGVDFRGSKLRLWLRRLMVRWADAFITNSKAGKEYLTNILHASEKKVSVQPYEIPVPQALLKEKATLIRKIPASPVFLFVGGLIPRKGVQGLLKACHILRESDCAEFTLLVIGDGPQRESLETFAKDHQLDECVQWLGRVDYGSLGAYFEQADVFILPTLEDTWGVVILEAMIFSKPILCSKWAGAFEVIEDGKNGFIFDPRQPKELANLMLRFIGNEVSADAMGTASKEIMERYTPTVAAETMMSVVDSLVTEL
ncbi:MAG: glycosyltransferase family 4 protein [Cyanothece sp. SIO1E1]|nr:glycosyltransferase family 4 protein [Cyanothece sp. SIO1E1]